MPLPLEIATTPHAHDAQVGEIIDLLCKPSICGPISDILGRYAFMEAATDLTQRLYLGECAAALWPDTSIKAAIPSNQLAQLSIARTQTILK